jgi:hypothetical protein
MKGTSVSLYGVANFGTQNNCLYSIDGGGETTFILTPSDSANGNVIFSISRFARLTSMTLHDRK